jgi:hypothetical protein
MACQAQTNFYAETTGLYTQAAVSGKVQSRRNNAKVSAKHQLKPVWGLCQRDDIRSHLGASHLQKSYRTRQIKPFWASASRIQELRSTPFAFVRFMAVTEDHDVEQTLFDQSALLSAKLFTRSKLVDHEDIKIVKYGQPFDRRTYSQWIVVTSNSDHGGNILQLPQNPLATDIASMNDPIDAREKR